MIKVVPSLLLLVLALPAMSCQEVQPITALDLPHEEATVAGEGGNADEKAPSLAKLLAEIEVKRSPASAAAALARPLPVGTEPSQQAARYEQQIAAGDWAGVGATLAALPAAQAKQLYGTLIEFLDEGMIASEDVLALAAIAPGGLDDKRVQVLGGLLRVALQQTEAVESLLLRLDAGAGPLGGRDAQARARAAALLLAAERDADAGRFLPLLAEARAAGDIRALELHARVLLARATRDDDAEALARAWDCSQLVLASTAADDAERRASAAQRLVEILPRLPTAQGDAWLDSCFKAGGEPARLSLAAIIAAAGNTLHGRPPEIRLAPLQLINRAAQSLLAVQDPVAWRPFLQALAIPWQVEAELVVGGPVTAQRPWMGQSREEVQAIPAEALVAIAPADAWLAQVDASLGLRLRRLAVEVIVRSADTSRGLALLGGLRGEQPQAADQLAEALVEAWVRRQGGGGGEEGSDYKQALAQYRKQLPTMNANTRQAWRQHLQRMRRHDQESGEGSAPITRARQVRLLGELAVLLGRLRSAQLHISGDCAIEAFAACHSEAEVFQPEDLAAVFGDSAALPVQLRVALGAAMRERLANTWRKPEVQQQARTNRTDAETAAEVERGYDLALGLLPDRIPGDSGSWNARLLRALLVFDYGEFRYERTAPLADYTGLRDRAFADFAAAADLAADSRQPAAADVQYAWFKAALGASDLAQLTRQDEADPGQMRRIAASLRAGTKQMADERLRLFASAVGDGVDQVEGSLRPRYLRKAGEILGQHPAGEALRKRLAGYDEILAEVALQLRPEGEGAVGTAPFVASLVLQHSSAIGRESGGFGRYLSRQLQHRSGVQVNYLGDFEKSIRESLEPRFHIRALRFQDPNVTARSCGKPGWRETPLAHLILSARDAAVDRLPPLQLDLDFPDAGGQVILPVSSSAVAIDARSAATPRPWAAGELVMTLDQRDPALLSLDVEARGRGLPDALTRLVELAQPGLVLGTVEEQGLSLVGDEEHAGALQAVAERRWRVSWTPGEARAFVFPQVSDAGLKVTRRRWQDGEAIDSPPSVALAGPAPRWWPWAVAAAGALLLALAGWRLLRRLRRRQAEPRWSVPQECTPFSVADLLVRIAAAIPSLRSAIDADRVALERRCFTPGAEGPPSADELCGLARQWADQANRAARPGLRASA